MACRETRTRALAAVAIACLVYGHVWRILPWGELVIVFAFLGWRLVAK